MSNDCAVDLAVVSEPSTRTVTSGSARHSVRIRSTMSSGTSTGALTREPAAYRRNAVRTAAAVDLKYSGGSMKPHSLNAEPLVTARR
jgi:hypothetical protein